MKLLVTGAAGQLGRVVCELARTRGHSVVPTDVVDGGDGAITVLDVTDADACRKLVGRERPEVVLHCGAWTDVDGCEGDPEKADLVNGQGTAHLAEACRGVDAGLVYVSTDYVFDGSVTGRPLVEDDPVGPLSSYGRSKRLGEEAVLREPTTPGFHVVRTAWVFGPGGRNFPKAIANRARQLAAESQNGGEGGGLTVVDDQIGCPTMTWDLAEVLLDLAASDQPSGVWHACNEGHCSWHAFAEAIVAAEGLRVPVAPMTTAELDRPAPRPAWSVLDCSKLTAFRGRPLPTWQDALQRYLAEERSLAQTSEEGGESAS